MCNLKIKHTIYPENRAEDYNIWINDIYNRPKQEDYSIYKNKVIDYKKPLGYFYFKAHHNIYKSLIQILLDI